MAPFSKQERIITTKKKTSAVYLCSCFPHTDSFKHSRNKTHFLFMGRKWRFQPQKKDRFLLETLSTSIAQILQHSHWTQHLPTADNFNLYKCRNWPKKIQLKTNVITYILINRKRDVIPRPLPEVTFQCVRVGLLALTWWCQASIRSTVKTIFSPAVKVFYWTTQASLELSTDPFVWTSSIT